MRAYRVAYDGVPYHGFQRQPDVTTIEDELLAGLADLEVIPDASTTPPGYAAAGRTDAGVSAVAQTIAFEAPPWLTPTVLDGATPADIGVWAHAEVPPGFHATHDAIERTYEYHLPIERDRFDAEAARTALDLLGDTHDFHNLTPDSTGTVRTLRTAFRPVGQTAVITVTADGFPRQLVRRLVEVVDRIGRGTAEIELIDRLLSDQPVDGPLGIPPAPSEPLVLTAVTYPDISFAVDDEAASSVAAAFTTRHHRLSARAMVAKRILDQVDDNITDTE